MKRVVLGLIIFGLIVYAWYSNTREHLTSGPPTLATLQKDTHELDEKIKKLNDEFQQMKQQASEGANAAATARLQVAAVKNS
jgi:hypothetical protein